MKNYTVYYLVKEILSVEVSAANEEEAKNRAEKILNTEKRKNIDCFDGTTEFAGINIDDVWSQLDE